jgi:putative membrane protein
VILAVLALAAIAAYAFAANAYRRRFPHRAFPAWRDACFTFGALAMVVALSPWADRAADASFPAHMAQHLALTLVGPPLLLLGAPLLVAVAVMPVAAARWLGRAMHWQPLQIVLSPAIGFLAFVAVLWVAHFSPLYEAALEHPPIHVLEHAAFVTSALLFWIWVLPSGSLPRPVAYPVRLFLTFLAIPQGAFLAIALQSARGVLYPHYLATQSVAQALAGQRSAGEIMWIGGGTLLFTAFVAIASEWAARERSAACA